MKKILCTLLAVLAIGCCFAGCVNHNDGKCDECKTEGGLFNPVTRNEEENEEYCTACWVKKYGEEWEEKLFGERDK